MSHRISRSESFPTRCIIFNLFFFLKLKFTEISVKFVEWILKLERGVAGGGEEEKGRDS